MQTLNFDSIVAHLVEFGNCAVTKSNLNSEVKKYLEANKINIRKYEKDCYILETTPETPSDLCKDLDAVRQYKINKAREDIVLIHDIKVKIRSGRRK